MSEWEETAKNMGWSNPIEESKFMSVEEGANDVGTYIKHEHVPCDQKERDKGYCDENGETIVYTFKSPLTGKERTLRRSSKGIFYAFKNAKVEPNQTVQIIRTGELKDTRYEIKVLREEEVKGWVEERKKAITEASAEMPDNVEIVNEEDIKEVPEEEINTEDIPF